MSKRVSLLAVAALACAVTALPASGQGASAPAPCAGLAATDPAGDTASTTTGARGGDNQDLRELYFRTERNVTTAYIRVVNLSKELPANPTVDGISWFAYWDDAEGVNNFVSVTVDSGGAPTYEYGTRDGTTLEVEGTTKGQFFEGPNGVVALQIPGAKAKAGTKLLAPTARASINALIGASGNGLRLFSATDDAPDEGAGKDYEIRDCAGGTDTTAPPAGTPGPGVTAPPAQTAPHSLTLVSRSAKARNKRKLSIKVRTSGPVKNLVATLKKRSRRLMTGKLATANGTVTVKLKGSRKLKKGSYTVDLVATNDDGRQSKGSGRLKIR